MESSTKILRRLLDERGVEWGNIRNDGSESDYLTEWQFEDNQGKAIAIEWAVGSGLSVEIHRYHLTPEQAIAATVGSDKVEAVLRKLIARLGVAADFHFARKYVDCIVEEYAGKLATLGAGSCKRVMDSIDPFAMWVCDHCGHPLDTSESFCGGCGRKVVAE